MKSEASNKSLGGIRILQGLSADDLDALRKRCAWRRFSVGQQIVGHQDDTHDVCFVVSGHVRVIIYSLSGKEVTFRDIASGEIFGELAAIDGERRSASVIALSDTLIASITASEFWDVLRTYPLVWETTLKRLTGYVRDLSERVFEFSTLAVKNRIHAELLRLAQDYMRGENWAQISPAPTHADIASRVSTHREAVTRELSELSHAGLVERVSGTLIVRDVRQLQKMVDEVLGNANR